MRYAATGLTLLLWPLAAWAQPSFDCAKAESSAEEAVCASPALSEMDVEVSRLFALALNGPNITPDGQDELRAYQRGWVKGRDECWKADDLATCLRAEQAACRCWSEGRGQVAATPSAGQHLGPHPRGLLQEQDLGPQACSTRRGPDPGGAGTHDHDLRSLAGSSSVGAEGVVGGFNHRRGRARRPPGPRILR